MRVTITFDHKSWDTLLAAWEEPAVKRTLQAGASAFGRAAKPIIKAEIPSARPGNKYAKGPGNLRALTKFRRIRSGIGVVVGPMGRGAYYRGWVSRGTKPHKIEPRGRGGRLKVLTGYARSVAHPGARPNDYIGRAQGRAESAGFDKAETVIFDGLDAKRVLETLDT